mmetsp:Transcript_5570/g.15627  ORF Transcript_5570/g.15627 Transcript_5570/m.15627 type:complete len:226 (-) Transcript_5570:293-970(-)
MDTGLRKQWPPECIDHPGGDDSRASCGCTSRRRHGRRRKRPHWRKGTRGVAYDRSAWKVLMRQRSCRARWRNKFRLRRKVLRGGDIAAAAIGGLHGAIAQDVRLANGNVTGQFPSQRPDRVHDLVGRLRALDHVDRRLSHDAGGGREAQAALWRRTSAQPLMFGDRCGRRLLIALRAVHGQRGAAEVPLHDFVHVFGERSEVVVDMLLLSVGHRDCVQGQRLQLP